MVHTWGRRESADGVRSRHETVRPLVGKDLRAVVAGSRHGVGRRWSGGRGGDGEIAGEQMGGVPVAESNGPVLVAVSRTATDGAADAVYRVSGLAVDGHLRAHSDGGEWQGGDGA